LRPEWKGRIEAPAIVDWCHENMAAFKVPRIVEFIDALPKSGSGKINWRELQDRERRTEAGRSAVAERGGSA
jgi:fatty-acyl-CoA synthase